MSAIHLLDYKAALWKSYPSPFDVHVRKIMKEKKEHPIYSKFLSVYIELRNFLFSISVEEIYYRRKNQPIRRSCPPNHDVLYNFEELKLLVFMMDEGLIDEDVLSIHETRLEFIRQGIHFQYINLLRDFRELRTQRCLYSNSKDLEMQSWYEYIRKLLGVYNVPRDDLTDRQAAKQTDREALKAFLDRTKEIVWGRKQPIKRYPPVVTMSWPISQAEVELTKNWMKYVRE